MQNAELWLKFLFDRYAVAEFYGKQDLPFSITEREQEQKHSPTGVYYA